MAMVFRQLLPLFTAIRAEPKTLFVAERIDGQAQDNRIEDRNLQVGLVAFDIEDIDLIEIAFNVIIFT
jgi:hypothetical protein